MTKREETASRQSEKTCKIIFYEPYFDFLVEEDGLFVTYDESKILESLVRSSGR